MFLFAQVIVNFDEMLSYQNFVGFLFITRLVTEISEA